MPNITLVLVTYNRPIIVREHLESNCIDYEKNDIQLLICDSSEDDKTQIIVEQFQNVYRNIEYKRYDSKTPLSIKQIESLYEAETEYICLCADAYIFEKNFITNLYKKIMNYDVCVFSDNDICKTGRVEYNEITSLFNNHVWWITCSSTVFFRRNFIFNINKEEFIKKYSQNVLNYINFYFTIIPTQCNILFEPTQLFHVSKNKKGSWWVKSKLDIWTKQWVEVIDACPSYLNCYKSKVKKDIDRYIDCFNLWTFIEMRINDYFDSKDLRKYKLYLNQCITKPYFLYVIISLLPRVLCKYFLVFRNNINLFRLEIKNDNK